MLLTVGIITKDAGHYLNNALDVALRLGDEVVVCVDRSSSDDTLAIAKLRSNESEKITSFEYDFVGFGAARNGLIDAAKGTWIFMLDSDEVLDPPSIISIRKHLSEGLREAIYSFPRHNWNDVERTSFQKKYYPDRQSRLFPADGRVNYGEQLVHEVPKGLPTIYFPDLELHIEHFCFAYRKHEDWERVNQFYKKLGSQLEDIDDKNS